MGRKRSSAFFAMAVITVGIVLTVTFVLFFQVPAVIKPLWMPHDPSFDSSFATAQANSTFSAPLMQDLTTALNTTQSVAISSISPPAAVNTTAVSAQVNQISSQISSGIPQGVISSEFAQIPVISGTAQTTSVTILPSQALAAANPSLQTAETNFYYAVQNLANVANSSQSQLYSTYAAYAPSHGVDFNKSWSMIIIALGNATKSLPSISIGQTINQAQGDGGMTLYIHQPAFVLATLKLPSVRPVIGTSVLTYSAPSKAFSTFRAPAKGLSVAAYASLPKPVYVVKATAPAVQAIHSSFSSQSFVGATNAYTGSLQKGNLQWSQK